MGPCMCGDIYCGLCGPLQGNNRCAVCGLWDEDREDPENVGRINRETDCLCSPEEIAAYIAAEKEIDDAIAQYELECAAEEAYYLPKGR